MAAAKLLGIVEPTEWLSRTSLLLRTRGPTLRKVDAAYAAYFNLRGEPNKLALYEALNAYLVEKGGNWERVERNISSGGLMAYLHNATRTAPLAQNILGKRIPEARHGLLYLWQHAEVHTQWAKVALEGALSIGGATLGMLMPDDTAATVLGKGVPAAGNLALAPKGQGSRNTDPYPETPPPSSSSRIFPMILV